MITGKSCMKTQYRVKLPYFPENTSLPQAHIAMTVSIPGLKTK